MPVACGSEDVDEIMAPVMEIMPELDELCREPSSSMSMLHLQVEPLETLKVASTPPPVEPSYIGNRIMPELQEICVESSVASMVELGSLESMELAMTSSPSSSKPSNIVDTRGVLSPNFEALFEKRALRLAR
jgi:hypothetical protein